MMSSVVSWGKNEIKKRNFESKTFWKQQKKQEKRKLFLLFMQIEKSVKLMAYSNETNSV